MKTIEKTDLLSEISTPLGPMVAAATSKGICLLEFTNRIHLVQEITELQDLLSDELVNSNHEHLNLLRKEIDAYFKAELKSFSVPLHLMGNEFSRSVWQYLLEIPYGSTCTYKDQADGMKSPKAIRAIASANGRNRLAILVPCHRVIGSNGKLTGYAAGTDKKRMLLDLERTHTAVAPGLLF